MSHNRIILPLLLGFLLANSGLFAAKKPTTPKNGKPVINSITDNLYGPTVQTAADGTRVIDNKDGSSVQIYPDGSLFIINSDGSTIQKNADGSEFSSSN